MQKGINAKFVELDIKVVASKKLKLTIKQAEAFF